jgi:hypothetical protein
VEQGRILHHDGVGLGDRLAQADRPVVDPAERDDRRPGALGGERRERLCLTAFAKGGNREQPRGGDDALPPASMEAHREHAAIFAAPEAAALRESARRRADFPQRPRRPS